MHYQTLGRTGLEVSRICLGTMTFGNPSQADERTSHEILDIAVEAGVNFIDTADVYPLDRGGDALRAGLTEEIIGRWLGARGNRDELVLATKVRGDMGGRLRRGLNHRWVKQACEDSLRRLGVDHIDLYQLHAPDPLTPIEETLDALNDLVRAGLVRYVGVSNFPAWQLMRALWVSDRNGYASFVSHQPRYNALFRMIEDEILPACHAHGVGVIAYNPLAGGMLTGRYRSGHQPRESERFGLPNAGGLYRKRYWNDEVLDMVTSLAEFFEGRGKSLTHAALAWVLAQEGVTSAIVGASRPEQLRETLAGWDTQLDVEELAALDGAWFSLPRERDPSVARR